MLSCVHALFQRGFASDLYKTTGHLFTASLENLNGADECHWIAYLTTARTKTNTATAKFNIYMPVREINYFIATSSVH